MSRFNSVSRHSTKTKTHEGGTAYLRKPEDEWFNMLFSYLFQRDQPSFYELASDKEKRFTELTHYMIENYGAALVGKAAVFSRNVLGMRTISAYLASILNGCDFESKRNFYKAYFHRPDDVSEIFAAIESSKGEGENHKISHALMRAASEYISGLSEYSLGKYKLEGHDFNMRDVVRLTHANSDAINKLMRGTLESPDTWEVKISTAADEAERHAEWKRLVEERKLGYLALIRNLRNICSDNSLTVDWYKEYLIPQIENESAIRKSLVFPYQIYVAYKQTINALSGRTIMPIELQLALSNAFRVSVNNVSTFFGKSLIVLDVSGSMDERFTTSGVLSIKEACAVYAVALYLSDNDFDLMKFGTRAASFSFPKAGNVFDLIAAFYDNDSLGYGTDIEPVFRLIDKHYDRIFLFSDMQVMTGCGWGSVSSNKLFSNYVREYGATKLYSFDLGHYANQIVSEDKDITYLTALNDTIFSAINILESGKSIVDIVEESVSF